MVPVKDEGFTPNAMKILQTRYFMKNEKGEFIDKKPSDLFRRVADYIASAEKPKRNRRNGLINF